MKNSLNGLSKSVLASALFLLTPNLFAAESLATTVLPDHPIAVHTSADLFIGSPNLGLDFGITHNINAGVGMRYADHDAFRIVNTSIEGAWFKSGVLSDSLYVRPSITLSKLTVKEFENLHNTITEEQTADVGSIGAVVGYQWMFEKNFFVNLAGGAQYYRMSKAIDFEREKNPLPFKIGKLAQSGLTPAAEFTFGKMF